MKALTDLWNREPARVIGVAVVLLDAALAIAVAYGLHVPAEVKTQIDVIGGVIITLFGVNAIRSQVTPVAKTP